MKERECANCGMTESDQRKFETRDIKFYQDYHKEYKPVSNSTFQGFVRKDITGAANPGLVNVLHGFTGSANNNFGKFESPFPSYGAVTYKYSEDKSLQKIKEYIDSTYKGHYKSGTDSDLQCIDVWLSRPSGITTCRDTVQKYLWRVGEKGNIEDHKTDIYKAIHYCFFILHQLEKNSGSNSK